MSSNYSTWSGKNHGFITRIFLRDCAFQMRLYKNRNDRWIWRSANYSTSTSLVAFVLFVFICCAIALRGVLPETINPLTASKTVTHVEFLVLGFSVIFYVEFVTKRFKDNVSAARQYTSGMDRIKWWLTTLITIGCAAGIGAVVVLFGGN